MNDTQIGKLRVIFEALNNGKPKMPQYPEANVRHEAALKYAKELLAEFGFDVSKAAEN